MGKTGFIFNIQRGSVYDGPGFRTVVFFKGCHLRCRWCHNPESWNMKPELELNAEKCIGCGDCFRNCPQKAHGMDETGAHTIDRSLCTGCGICAQGCCTRAITMVGEAVTAEYVERAILADKAYGTLSGGGVTFSGGECMLQIDFLSELLHFSKLNGLHTAVDTCGDLPWSAFERILGDTDLFLYDIKAADQEVHRALTGVSNERLLQNLKKLHERGKKVIIRVPYIPGGNDGEVDGIGRILSQYPDYPVELLGYHRMGEGKYRSLSLSGVEFTPPDEDELKRVLDKLVSYGLNATCTSVKEGK